MFSGANLVIFPVPTKICPLIRVIMEPKWAVAGKISVKPFAVSLILTTFAIYAY